MADLNDILNPQEPEAPQPEPEVTEPPEPQPEPAPQPGEEPSPSPGEPQPKPEEDPAAAVRAELAALSKERQRLREKEQALEAERQKLAQKPEEKPDFWEDPEKRLTEVEQRIEQRLQRERLDLSEMYARDKHADFDDKLEVFKGMVQENPALYHQMIQQSNPAEFAYRQAASHQKLKEMGDPQEYEQKLREKIESETRAKIEAEYEAKKAAEVEAAIKAKLGKGGFVETRSVATNSTKQPYQGPTPLKSIFN